jgi:hypothetical protein
LQGHSFSSFAGIFRPFLYLLEAEFSGRIW